MLKPTLRPTVADDLRIILPRRTRLTADQAFDLGRDLLRVATRAIMREELERPMPRRRAPRGR